VHHFTRHWSKMPQLWHPALDEPMLIDALFCCVYYETSDTLRVKCISK
jgi:hypothetical protein